MLSKKGQDVHYKTAGSASAYGDNIHWKANESLLHKIDSPYNRIARFVSKWGYYTHHCTMFEELGWPL